jgi:hypothetical protein
MDIPKFCTIPVDSVNWGRLDAFNISGHLFDTRTMDINHTSSCLSFQLQYTFCCILLLLSEPASLTGRFLNSFGRISTIDLVYYNRSV